MGWRSRLHAAIRHPGEPSVLLLRSDRAWRLPRVLVSEAVWGANAQVIVPALERRLGTRLWLLRRLASTEDESARRIDAVFELELVDLRWELPAHARWVGSPELARLRLKDEEHRPLLAAYLEAAESGRVPEGRPPWALPGWHAQARAWIEQETARLGHELLRVNQVKQWSISSVLRVETDGPELYFKTAARLPLFADEAAVTLRLAERFPAHVPAPLAVEPSHGWMLLPAFDELFAFDGPLALRQEALRRFARLQRQSAELVDGLLADGCLDRRLEVLETQIEPLVNDPEAVARLTEDEAAELRRLTPALIELCRRLGTLGFPPTLVHGDLHLGNVTRLGGELAYFDWTDACVAHPFIDLLLPTWEEDETSRVALLDAYLEPWAGLESPERTREAVALAGVVIPLHHAVSYRHIVAGLEPVSKPELDATHYFLRRALTAAREFA